MEYILSVFSYKNELWHTPISGYGSLLDAIKSDN